MYARVCRDAYPSCNGALIDVESGQVWGAMPEQTIQFHMRSFDHHLLYGARPSEDSASAESPQHVYGFVEDDLADESDPSSFAFDSARSNDLLLSAEETACARVAYISSNPTTGRTLYVCDGESCPDRRCLWDLDGTKVNYSVGAYANGYDWYTLTTNSLVTPQGETHAVLFPDRVLARRAYPGGFLIAQFSTAEPIQLWAVDYTASKTLLGSYALPMNFLIRDWILACALDGYQRLYCLGEEISGERRSQVVRFTMGEEPTIVFSVEAPWLRMEELITGDRL
jgi:hypothetical protein